MVNGKCRVENANLECACMKIGSDLAKTAKISKMERKAVKKVLLKNKPHSPSIHAPLWINYLRFIFMLCSKIK